MGSATDFVGHIDVRPPLNATEAAYVDELARVRPGRATPSPWVPGADGARLVVERGEDPQHLASSLRRLVNDLLKDEARLRGLHRQAPYDEFGFDHVLDGMVVGCRRASGELFAITARANRVTRRMLLTTDPASPRARRRPAPRQQGATVIDLATRRLVSS